MQEIYPDYADKVDVYAVSFDTFQDLAALDKHGKDEGWPWPVVMPVGSMIRDYQIAIWATKIAFDSKGNIVYRAGPGAGTDEEFRRVLQQLASSS